MDGFDCFYILDEPPNCYISPKDLGREWNKNKVSGWKSCAPAPQEKGGWHLEQREREAGCSHKAHSSLLGWTTRLTRPHFIMRIGMLLCHLSLCSSYIIVRGFKSLFYRKAVETKQYLCITVDFCHLPSAVYLLLIRKNQVGWTPAHTGEMDRWGTNCEKHAKKNKEKKEKMFDGRGVLKQELMIMVLWWERCV